MEGDYFCPNHGSLLLRKIIEPTEVNCLTQGYSDIWAHFESPEDSEGKNE